MRLWSIHPAYLDPQGLVAAWREALLAKKVLEGKTRGYTHHPQLARFLACRNPVDEINAYLDELYKESLVRTYRFNREKITYRQHPDVQPVLVTDGQVDYEFRFLQEKLKKRNRQKYEENSSSAVIRVNGLFSVIDGGIADWEKVKIF
jgi:hypothetical protein